MNPLAQTLKNLGATRLAILGVSAMVLIAFFGFLMSKVSTGDMQLLYGNLDPSDAGAISARLDQLNVPYEVNPAGTSIMVPSADVGRLRMALAQDGLPSGGNVGYEIFDDPAGFGTTNFVQNINQLRALEGELARTVSTLNGVRSARIHLVMPKRELFSREPNEPSASVFLQLRGGSIGREQVAAIQSLVAAAVPRLQPNQISVIDQTGKLLARGGEDDDAYMAQTAEEMRRGTETRLARQIEDLVGNTVGFGNVRATVTAEMDFDRLTQSTEVYDPERSVVRSTQTVEEENTSQEVEPVDPVTVGNNIPQVDGIDPLNTPGSTSASTRAEETTNFEVSKTVTNVIRGPGEIERLSVAVLVDGLYTDDGEGNAVYSARSAEEMDQIRALVASAIGLDPGRGDSLEIVNMRFAPPPVYEEDVQFQLLGMGKADLMRIAELLVLAIVAVLVLLLVVRPLVSRVLNPPPPEEPTIPEERLLTDQSGGAQGQLAGPAGASGVPAEGMAFEGAGEESDLERMIDITQVDGRVRASSLRKIGEIVERHPEEAVSILRNWIYQET